MSRFGGYSDDELRAHRAELAEALKQVEDELELRRRETLPLVEIVGPCRPLYMEGCRGRMDGWSDPSTKRRYFWPEPGNAMYERSNGRYWTVGESLMRPV